MIINQLTLGGESLRGHYKQKTTLEKVWFFVFEPRGSSASSRGEKTKNAGRQSGVPARLRWVFYLQRGAHWDMQSLPTFNCFKDPAEATLPAGAGKQSTQALLGGGPFEFMSIYSFAF